MYVLPKQWFIRINSEATPYQASFFQICFAIGFIRCCPSQVSTWHYRPILGRSETRGMVGWWEIPSLVEIRSDILLSDWRIVLITSHRSGGCLAGARQVCWPPVLGYEWYHLSSQPRPRTPPLQSSVVHLGGLLLEDAKKSYAIKNQLGHPKPHCNALGGILLALR